LQNAFDPKNKTEKQAFDPKNKTEKQAFDPKNKTGVNRYPHVS